MTIRTRLLASLVASLSFVDAQAAVITFTGDTTSAPTYDRITVDQSGNPTGLSAVGSADAVAYRSYTFNVAVGGTYSFTTAGAFDTFASLYSGTFNASMPAAGALIGNDDLTGGIGTSGFSYNLAPGTYSFVTTGASNGQAGYFSDSINGPGAISITSAAVTASPRVLTYTGTTSGGPTYDRADDGGDNTTFVATTDGTGVSYSTFSFQVGAVGSYAFVSNGDYDTFLSLYQGFDPSKPLSNGIALDDDASSGTDPSTGYGIAVHDVSAFYADQLLTGVTYTLVTSGYDSDASGFFSNAIVGPGAISAVVAVPEPDLIALMLTGFGLVGFTTRRRKSKA